MSNTYTQRAKAEREEEREEFMTEKRGGETGKSGNRETGKRGSGAEERESGEIGEPGNQESGKRG
jgi:hypothetical protein